MINWKLRFKNKATLLTLLLTLVAFVYQILGILNIVPPVSQDSVTQIVTLVVNALAMFGIVIDPTTAGVSDSEKALNYDVPRKDGE